MPHRPNTKGKQPKLKRLGHLTRWYISSIVILCYILLVKCPYTVSWDDFKQNCKNSQQDLRRIKKFASEIPNLCFSKSLPARQSSGYGLIGPIQHYCLAVGFHAPTARILRKTELELLLYRSYWKLFQFFFQIILGHCAYVQGIHE